jgi:hypothetical protein
MPIELDYLDFKVDNAHSQSDIAVNYSNRNPNPERS